MFVNNGIGILSVCMASINVMYSYIATRMHGYSINQSEFDTRLNSISVNFIFVPFHLYQL